MNFKERVKPTTQVKFNQSIVPKVLIDQGALLKMFIYTDEVADEVGWLGTVDLIDPENRIYHIKDVFLFKQQVHGTTTEITTEGLSEFGEKLLEQPDGMDIWNSLRMWGHSHVNMPINPSGQDDSQMVDFSKNGQPYFIRLICNKKGDMKLDFFDYENGLTFLDVPWQGNYVQEDASEEIEIDTQVEALEAEIERLQQAKDAIVTAKVNVVRDPIKAEIKEKVSKLVYQAPAKTGTQYGWGGSYYQNPYQGTKAPTSSGTLNILDFFNQQEINAMGSYVFSRDHFVEELEAFGLQIALSYPEITSLYNQFKSRSQYKY